MWVKMGPNVREIANEEFAIAYPGKGDASFLLLWYNKGAQGQTRLQTAREKLQLKNVQENLLSKALQVKDGNDAAGPGPGAETSSVVWQHLEVYAEESEETKNAAGEVTGKDKIKLVKCCVLGCGWTGKLKNGSTGLAVKHFKSFNTRKTVIATAHHRIAEALGDSSPNTYKREDGTKGTYKGFDEQFENHVNFTFCVAEDILSANSLRHRRVKRLVKGFDEAARPPCPQTVTQISDVIYGLMQQKQKYRLKALREKCKGKDGVGLQSDLWTDTSNTNKTSFGAINLCYVETDADGKVSLVDELLDMNVFPHASHTADNLQGWFETVLKEKGIPHSMVSCSTVDGASNGKATMRQIVGFEGKVSTCLAHQLQRGILRSMGDGVKCKSASKNIVVRECVRKHSQLATLFHQSYPSIKFLKEEQILSGVVEKDVLGTRMHCETRWGGKHDLVTRNNIIEPYLRRVVQDRMRDGGILKGMTFTDDEAGEMPLIKEMTQRDLTLTDDDWERSRQIQAGTRKAYESTTLIETSSAQGGGSRSLCPDQCLFSVWDVQKDSAKPTLWVPGPRAAGPSRRRKLYQLKSTDLKPDVQLMRNLLVEELDERVFKNHSHPITEAHIVMLRMSKQPRPENAGWRELLGESVATEADLAFKRRLTDIYENERWGFKRGVATSTPMKRKVIDLGHCIVPLCICLADC